jgi:hypothetical protein
MTSSSGRAVEFPGAKADSTGVTMRVSMVGDGSCTGTEVAVGAAVGAAQAFKMSINDKIIYKAKWNFFI